jgi:hypothetical protein
MCKVTTAWCSGKEKSIQDAFEALLFPLSGDAREVALVRGGSAPLPEWMQSDASGACGFHHGGYAPFKYRVPTLRTKKPDSVRYAAGSEGELCMVAVGELKVKRGTRGKATAAVTENLATTFSDADRYELLEYLEILMDHQPDRAYCYGFLSSGCRTQIARMTRCAGGDGYAYCLTAEFMGEDAVWAVLSVMMMNPATLGYTSLALGNFPGCTVCRTLSVTDKTIVLDTRQENPDGSCTKEVMKLYRTHRGEHRRDREVHMISAARGALVRIRSPIRRESLLACLPEVVKCGSVGYGDEAQVCSVTFRRACTPIQELSTMGRILTCQQQAQVVELIYYLHKAGILHRDIKPNNIMLYEPEDVPSQVVLLDFDCAIETGVDLTRPGAIAATPERGWAGNMQCGLTPSNPYCPCARDDLIPLVRAFYLNVTLDLTPEQKDRGEGIRDWKEEYWARVFVVSTIYRHMVEAVDVEDGDPYESLLRFLLPAGSPG